MQLVQHDLVQREARACMGGGGKGVLCMQLLARSPSRTHPKLPGLCRQSPAPGFSPFTLPAFPGQRPSQQRGGFLVGPMVLGSGLKTSGPLLEILEQIESQGPQRRDEEGDQEEPLRILGTQIG